VVVCGVFVMERLVQRETEIEIETEIERKEWERRVCV
jgi:hypothetical protein